MVSLSTSSLVLRKRNYMKGLFLYLFSLDPILCSFVSEDTLIVSTMLTTVLTLYRKITYYVRVL